jgi:ribosome-binding protein aMBF1 (putative translation factor)
LFAILLSMKKLGKLSPGRPQGSTSYDPSPAIAFGSAVRERRLAKGLSQEDLSSLASVERSHMGKIERGEHLPNLVLILRLAEALEVRAGLLVDRATEIMDSQQ